MTTGKVFIIRDAAGERRLDESALPFGVGHGEEAHLRLPGDGEGARAWIAFDRGHAFLQVDEGEAGLFHNRRHLSGSAWLKSGDIVQVGGAVLRWQVDGDQVFIDIEIDHAVMPAIRPPSEPPPVEPLPAPRLDEPLPHVADAPRRPTSPWLVRGLIAGAVLVALLAAFVLLATPFEVDIQPPPDARSVDGFPPPFRFGGRVMALPGEYRVRASKAGYLPLDATLDVRSGEFQRHEFRMVELPGWLALDVRPDVPVRVWDGGTEIVAAADGRFALQPGTHALRVEAGRYLPATLAIEVPGRDREVAATLELTPAWADVTLASTPAGARIELDGDTIGQTPASFEVLGGEHELTLSREGFKPWQQRLQAEPGVARDLGEITLEPLDGELDLGSDPPGATVTLNGAYIGTTPLRVALKPGVGHELKLSKAGRQGRTLSVTLESGRTRSENVALAAEFGVVFLSADPADAELFIDGQAAGPATKRLNLPTRTHRIEVRKPGYVTERLEITPRVGVAQRIAVELKTAEQIETERREAARVARKTTADGQTLHLFEPSAPFEMGAPRREAGRRANESERLVALTRPYFLAEKEVSNAQFKAFKAAHDSGMAEGQSLSRPEQPVVNVSWDDAARYCNWLSAKEGLPAAYQEVGGHMQPVVPMTTGYRLPSEAEWAYAARVAGRAQASRYAWGDSFPPPSGSGNWADKRIDDVFAVTVPDYDDGFRVSAPVGSFRPNPAGLYDLGGNVAEWTNDWYALYPGEAATLVENPTGPPTGEHHVVRDTGWKHGSISELRLAYRDYSREPRNDLGFRVARHVY
ncbi:MAG: SUMF1/EgtB/PvdO family nonheme iron enzyme [Gammaproteobacteria bacterium]|nr:SUMF1/EgtB/PvdO family nonheme iron enzyme [Gammaproteobacteria bacterium]